LLFLFCISGAKIQIDSRKHKQKGKKYKKKLREWAETTNIWQQISQKMLIFYFFLPKVLRE